MKKILVIEDEPEMRRNIASLLHYRDYEPVIAANGREGLDTARREKPDLILCDAGLFEATFQLGDTSRAGSEQSQRPASRALQGVGPLPDWRPRAPGPGRPSH